LETTGRESSGVVIDVWRGEHERYAYQPEPEKKAAKKGRQARTRTKRGEN